MAETEATQQEIGFGGLVRKFQLPVFGDRRGALVPFEFADLPFVPVRAFLVSAPAGMVRGEHGHKSGRQFLIRVAGEIEVECVLEGSQMSFVLSEEGSSLLVSSPVWAQQTYRGQQPQLLVLCDLPYDPGSYVLTEPEARLISAGDE